MSERTDIYLFFPFLHLISSLISWIYFFAEPDALKWENIEVPYQTQISARLRTNLITFIFLLVGFAIILQASIYKQIFEQAKPDLSLCDKEIPARFYGSYDQNEYTKVMHFARADPDVSYVYDSSCKSIVGKDSFYGVYGQNGDFSKPSVNYSLSACIPNATNPFHNSSGLCPGDTDFQCPCMSLSADQSCSTLMCSETPTETTCKKFPSTTIANCYCMSALSLLITGTKGGLGGFVSRIRSSMDNDPCKNFYGQYLSALGLSYLAIFINVVVNLAIKAFIEASAKYEYHSSTDGEQAYIVVKVFVSTFLNMIVVVLVAFARYDNIPSALKDVHFLQGAFLDFDRNWYPAVGATFVLTYVIEVVSLIGINLLTYFVIAPCTRRLTYPSVRNIKSHSIVCQKDLNQKEVGPIFSPTGNTAELLLLTFFAMTFGGGCYYHYSFRQ